MVQKVDTVRYEVILNSRVRGVFLTQEFRKYQDTGNRLVQKKRIVKWGWVWFCVKNDPISCMPSSWVTYSSKVSVYRNNVKKELQQYGTSAECWLDEMSLLYFNWKSTKNKIHFSNNYDIDWSTGWSQRPRGLRRGSASARLQGLRVRIPLGHGFLSLVSFVYSQAEVSALSWSLVRRSPTESGASEWDRKTSIMRRPWPIRGCCAIGRGEGN
jgi:hypothetical protein